MVHERYNQNLQCIYSSNDSTDINRSYSCVLKLPDGTEFKGYGKNKRLAKYNACQKAKDNF